MWLQQRQLALLYISSSNQTTLNFFIIARKDIFFLHKLKIQWLIICFTFIILSWMESFIERTIVSWFWNFIFVIYIFFLDWRRLLWKPEFTRIQQYAKGQSSAKQRVRKHQSGMAEVFWQPVTMATACYRPESRTKILVLSGHSQE